MSTREQMRSSFLEILSILSSLETDVSKITKSANSVPTHYELDTRALWRLVRGLKPAGNVHGICLRTQGPHGSFLSQRTWEHVSTLV